MSLYKTITCFFTVFPLYVVHSHDLFYTWKFVLLIPCTYLSLSVPTLHLGNHSFAVYI